MGFDVLTTSNLSNAIKRKPIGEAVRLIGLPGDGNWLPADGTLLPREFYDKLNITYPGPPTDCVMIDKTLPVIANWRDGVFGGGAYVIVGGDTGNQTDQVIISDDNGVTFSASALPSTDEWGSIDYDASLGVYIAVKPGWNKNTCAAASGDFIWTEHTMGGYLAYCRAIASNGAGRFVGVGAGNGGNNGVTSTDGGLTWSPLSIPSLNYGRIFYVGGLFIATSLDSTSSILTSASGTAWNTITLPEAGVYTAAAYGNGTYALFNASNVLTSADASAGWSISPLPATSTWSAAYVSGGFVLADYTMQNVHITPDLQSWTTVSTGTSENASFMIADADTNTILIVGSGQSLSDKAIVGQVTIFDPYITLPNEPGYYVRVKE